MRTLDQLQVLAEKKTTSILNKMSKLAALKRRFPGKLAHASVEVQIMGAAKMIKLNQQYRKKRKVTDVLSFPVDEVFQRQNFMGSIVICAPVLKAQAKGLGHRVEEELEVLITHGLLHLLGFDHEVSAAEAKIMAKFEAKLVKRRGLIERVSAK